LQGSGRLLHVTGHSLGGALATLAALRLQKERLYPVQTVYTYGSPRAGDSDFALAFDALLGTRCHRVVNNEDLVTRVPMRSMGYKHIGQIAYIDERGVLRFDVGYWYRFLNLVANASASLEVAAKTSFRDHSMTLYRQHLDKGLV
jgi:triacylglycerol lipase